MAAYKAALSKHECFGLNSNFSTTTIVKELNTSQTEVYEH